MELTAATFEQISHSLRSDPSTGRDQRSEPRVGLRAKSKIVLLAADGKPTSALEVRVRDLSAKGIGLITTKMLPNASQFVLRLKHQDGTALDIVYKVTGVHPSTGGTFVVGAVRLTPVTPTIKKPHHPPAQTPAA